MCLYLNRKKLLPSIALTSKTVYKIVHPNENKTAFTPIIFDNNEWFYKLGIGAKSSLIRQGRRIDEGLHSFIKLEEAEFSKNEAIAYSIHKNYKKNYVVLECKIPRFSKYYKNSEHYASNRLIPIKVIE